jgi:auxin efflux carrier family protein
MEQEAGQIIAMERSLLEKMIEAQGGGGESIIATLKYAILPIAKVFTMCFLGYLMASKYVNILTANGRKLLNGVFSFLFIYSYFQIFFLFL